MAAPGLSCSTWNLLVAAWGLLSCSMHEGSSSLTRDWTWAPWIGSVESYLLGHQGSPKASWFFNGKVWLETTVLFLKNIYLFIYLWLCWAFVSVRGLSLVVASGGHSSPWCAGLSLSRPLLLRSTGSRRAGSVIVAHGPSCSAACGIFPGQGLNPCPLHWQVDSQPLRHQGSPETTVL